MGKYKLNFGKLNSTEDVECLEFTSAKKRRAFIAERVIATKPNRVFILVIEYEKGGKYNDVFIFDQWSGIQSVVSQRWKDFWLFECVSYEDAYATALDLKEVNPLCYT